MLELINWKQIKITMLRTLSTNSELGKRRSGALLNSLAMPAKKRRRQLSWCSTHHLTSLLEHGPLMQSISLEDQNSNTTQFQTKRRRSMDQESINHSAALNQFQAAQIRRSVAPDSTIQCNQPQERSPRKSSVDVEETNQNATWNFMQLPTQNNNENILLQMLNQNKLNFASLIDPSHKLDKNTVQCMIDDIKKEATNSLGNSVVL